MRLPRVEARALIARLKVHGVAFDSARRAVVFIDSDAWHRTAEIGTVCRFASADSLRMGDGPVTEWISWPLRTEQAYRAAVLRNDALRVHWSITSFVTSFVTRKVFVMRNELRNDYEAP